MKYIIISKGYNEPDNNTPRLMEWARVVDIEPNQVARFEKVIEQELSGEYKDCEVNTIPLSEMIDDDYLINEEY